MFRRFGGFNNTEQAENVMWDNNEEFQGALSSCMARVFMRMFSALVVTAIAAFAVTQISALETLVYGNEIVFLLLVFAPVILVMVISAGINKMKASTASVLFYIYSAVNGLTLSFIFYVYAGETIFQAFAVAALMFACMSIYGYTTKKDLTRIGSLLVMALFGIIIASLVNMFMRSEAMSWLISYVAVVVFVGLTAYDTQRIKHMLSGAVEANQTEAIKKVSIIGALHLYLNFINLFLQILRILGRKR